MQLTLTAEVTGDDGRTQALPSGFAMRPATAADIDELGALYFAAYPEGIAGATVDEATDDISAGFDGTYGELWLDASPVVERVGRLVGAIQVVRQAPWDVPPNPFTIELFVAAEHRRRGLAAALIASALSVLAAAGESSVSLRVDSTNTAALQLYQLFGFSLSRAADVGRRRTW